ncbi:MAG: 4Fe-4S cluster-binding domain-containing protein [Chloroflexota bacterium]|nr:MAG: 4Fe-4S cluster-binding domain-containing protein [Chloroflexota bacterium]
MGKIKLPQPISAGLMLSYQCNANCHHCMYACSPRWKDWISEEEIKLLLTILAEKIEPNPSGKSSVSLNCGLHFTGGEPFLNFDLLLKAVQMARQLDIPSTFVETNCYWCLDNTGTKQKLEALKEGGLQGILISVNPFYLEYVPFERTERCIKIASEVFAYNTMVYQQEYYYRFKELGIKARLPLEEYLKLEQGDLVKNVELFLMGRASYKLQKFYTKHPPDYFLNEPCLPPLVRNWHNHFDNYGNWIPGYCGGISLGNWHDLDRLCKQGLDLDEQPVLGFLIKQDFAGLIDYSRNFGYEVPREGYISKCHLCVDIRRYLTTKQEFKELKPNEFYSQL